MFGFRKGIGLATLATDQGGSNRLRQNRKGYSYRDIQDEQDENQDSKTYGLKPKKIGDFILYILHIPVNGFSVYSPLSAFICG